MLAIHSMQLQKGVKSNPKQPSCKKVCAPPKKAIVKKDVKSKMVAKKWLDGRLMAKILIMTIQVNLVPNPSETWQHKFTFINTFAISLPSSHFLAATLDISHLFSQ